MPDPREADAVAASSQPNVAGAPAELVLSAKMWALVVATGCGAGLTSGLLMRMLRWVQHVSFAYSTGDFLVGVQGVAGSRRVLVLVFSGLFAAASLALLRRLSGSTGAEITGAIWHDGGAFQTAPTVAKALISITIVGMGAAVGREAALKDIGATVASWSSTLGRLTPAQRHLLVACGAGAGMAAAYNVPAGGALFAIEVLLGTTAIDQILAALLTSVIAVTVSWLLLPNEPTFQVSPPALTPSLLLWAALVGPVLGVASAGYVHVIRWAENHRPRGWLGAGALIAVFSSLGVVSVWYPEVLGNGKNVVQAVFAGHLSISLLLALLLLRPLATALCLKAGTPGGLFTPTMTFGALLGALAGAGWRLIAPAGANDSFAIVGAGAMLAAASQGPISSIVFMLELTNHTDTLIVPLMLAAGGATLVARRLNEHSIYSVR